MTKENQNGRSMVEMLLVIGIIGVLSISAMQVVGAVYGRWKLSRVTSELRDIQRNISRRYAVAGYYDQLKDFSAEEMVQEKLVPESMLYGAKLAHSFSGEVNVEPVKIRASASHYERYTITFKKLPLSACRDLLLLNWQVKGGTDLVSICAGEKCAYWNSESNKLPADLTLVGEFCAGNLDNELVWEFQ